MNKYALSGKPLICLTPSTGNILGYASTMIRDLGIRAIIFFFNIMAIQASPLLLYEGAYSSENGNLSITEGIASGDVTDHSVVIWSRVNKQALMNVEYDTAENFLNPKSKSAMVSQVTDFTGHIRVENLTSNSQYYYRVWFSTGEAEHNHQVSDISVGSFRTAPADSISGSTSFVIGGDLGGQGYCRRTDMGYSIFSIMRALSPDFFLFNGDQIYADSECLKGGPRNVIGWDNIQGNFSQVRASSVDWSDLSQLHDVYLKHWEYNRDDTHLKSLLQNTSMYAQFDDHEVIDNYGGNWSYLPGEFKNRTGYTNLVKTGISIFSNFSPIDTNKEGQYSFHRLFHWGSNLDLFILDTRSFRSSNDVVDTEENSKTILGKEQKEWLKQGLLNSTATWKIISTSVPIAIPTCPNDKPGCDSWATNGTSDRTFTRERLELLEFLDDNNIQNVVFIVTDVHSPSNILISQDFNDDGDKSVLYELVNGPLSAVPLNTFKLDQSLDTSLLYNESKIFNFGYVRIRDDPNDGKAHFIYKIIDENGIIRQGSQLDLLPR